MSQYLVKSKALFLHIPRTGGTTVERFLKSCEMRIQKWYGVSKYKWIGRKHTLLTHYDLERLAKVDFIFAIVRHPVSYYESKWRWMTKQIRVGRHIGIGKVSPRWSPNWFCVDCYQQEFVGWADMMLDRHPCWVTRLIEQYVGPPGGEFCNYIGRTETLREDCFRVLELLGYEGKFQFPRRRYNNVRTRVVPHIDWPDHLRARVEKDERVMIDRFYGKDTVDRREYRPMDSVWNSLRG